MRAISFVTHVTNNESFYNRKRINEFLFELYAREGMHTGTTKTKRPTSFVAGPLQVIKFNRNPFSNFADERNEKSDGRTDGHESSL
jgi:hypothetical protein